MRAKILFVTALVGFAGVGVPGQVGPTIIPNAGSQANSPAAGLVLFGNIPSLALPSGFTIIDTSGVSATLVWTVVGAFGPTPLETLILSGSVDGAPNMPLALGVSLSQTPSPSCSLSGGGPSCPPGTILLGNTASPFGLYHLTSVPFLIYDGIGGTAPAATTGASGSFNVAGALAIGGANPATTYHMAFQALVADPTAAAGHRLTAAFTIAQWIIFP